MAAPKYASVKTPPIPEADSQPVWELGDGRPHRPVSQMSELEGSPVTLRYTPEFVVSRPTVTDVENRRVRNSGELGPVPE